MKSSQEWSSVAWNSQNVTLTQEWEPGEYTETIWLKLQVRNLIVATLQSLLVLSSHSFGGMLGSGIKAAKEAVKLFNKLEIVDGEVVGEKSS